VDIKLKLLTHLFYNCIVKLFIFSGYSYFTEQRSHFDVTQSVVAVLPCRRIIGRLRPDLRPPDVEHEIARMSLRSRFPIFVAGNGGKTEKDHLNRLPSGRRGGSRLIFVGLHLHFRSKGKGFYPIFN